MKRTNLMAITSGCKTSGSIDSNPCSYGVILREMSYIGKARNVLVSAVRASPCNWSAWVDLAALCPDIGVVSLLGLPTGIKPVRLV